MEAPASAINFYYEEVDFKISCTNQLSEWIMGCIAGEGKTAGAINFIYCADDYLHKINVDRLNHDTFTDVITFDLSMANEISGDIFISVDRVRENALKFSQKVENEMNRVMIHGVLHLLGYGDKSESEKKEMRRKEDYCLSLRTFSKIT